MDGEAIIVCWPTADGAAIGIPGSTKERCSVCGTEVWISPTGVDIQKNRPAAIACIACALREAKKTGGMKVEPASAEQKAEIDEMLHALKQRN